jgi:hypothetical protein
MVVNDNRSGEECFLVSMVAVDTGESWSLVVAHPQGCLAPLPWFL